MSSKFKKPVGHSLTLKAPVSLTIPTSEKVSEKKIPQKTTGQNSKSDKLFSVRGTIEEFLAYLGVIKSSFFASGTDNRLSLTSSTKLFIYARITQIQECLIDIISVLAIGVLKKIEFSVKNIDELNKDMEKMGVDMIKIKSQKFIPGSCEVEACLFYARSLCRKVERQLASGIQGSFKDLGDKNIFEYINRLGDYLLALTIHILNLLAKQPLQTTRFTEY